MGDLAALMEMRRRQNVMRKRREAMERSLEGCDRTSKPIRAPIIGSTMTRGDYPHDKRRDIFGIGGYDNSPENHISLDEMMDSLRFETASGNQFVPEVYHALRRRERLLKNNLMVMGSLTAFADYFPLWTRTEGQGGRECDGCQALQAQPRRGGRRLAWQ